MPNAGDAIASMIRNVDGVLQIEAPTCALTQRHTVPPAINDSAPRESTVCANDASSSALPPGPQFTMGINLDRSLKRPLHHSRVLRWLFHRQQLKPVGPRQGLDLGRQ